MYEPNISPDYGFWCCPASSGETEYLDTNAYFGRFGCDLPKSMVERAFEKMKADNPDLNYILVPGDYVGHSIGVQEPFDTVSFKDAQAGLASIKTVTDEVAALFEKYFKDIPVLPTFGNNDTKYHYQPPFGLNENRFYEFWNNTWFAKHSGNQNIDNLADIA